MDRHFSIPRFSSHRLLGTPGNAARRFFYGLGMFNSDIAFAEIIPVVRI
jgi:hypothetical protein